MCSDVPHCTQYTTWIDNGSPLPSPGGTTMVRNRGGAADRAAAARATGFVRQRGVRRRPAQRPGSPDSRHFWTTGQEVVHLLTYPGEIRAKADQHRRRHTFTFSHETQQDVLRPDVAVIELQCLAERQLQDLLGARREGWGTSRHGARRPYGLDDLVADGLHGNPQRLQGFGPHSIALPDQSQQDVLSPDERVVELARFLLGECQHPPSPVGEAFEHRSQGSFRTPPVQGLVAGHAFPGSEQRG